MAFQRVATVGDLAEGTAMKVDVGGEPICLVRRPDGEIRALHDTCSHQQYSLSEGWVEPNAIECSLHGSAFDLDSGAPHGLPAVVAIPVYACAVRDGAVWVDPDRQLNDAPVPRH